MDAVLNEVCAPSCFFQNRNERRHLVRAGPNRDGDFVFDCFGGRVCVSVFFSPEKGTGARQTRNTTNYTSVYGVWAVFARFFVVVWRYVFVDVFVLKQCLQNRVIGAVDGAYNGKESFVHVLKRHRLVRLFVYAHQEAQHLCHCNLHHGLQLRKVLYTTAFRWQHKRLVDKQPCDVACSVQDRTRVAVFSLE